MTPPRMLPGRSVGCSSRDARLGLENSIKAPDSNKDFICLSPKGNHCASFGSQNASYRTPIAIDPGVDAITRKKPFHASPKAYR